MTHQKVLILDFGSQYTQLIARRVRELGIFSEILPGNVPLTRIKDEWPSFIILSGGPSSVYDQGAPSVSSGFWQWQAESRIPVLGICYGLQLMAQAFGGKIERAERREYGRMPVIAEPGSQLFTYCASEGGFQAWMSHGDETKDVPPGFQVAGTSNGGAIAAIEWLEKRLFGLQFHPEVTHTDGGTELLKHVLVDLGGLSGDWNMGSVVGEQIEAIKSKVGEGEHAICALSGGVDSTVAACLAHRALGDRLHCVFVDHGLLRHKEQERVMRIFGEHLHLKVNCIDASSRFLRQLRGVRDPEKKRKIIGSEFIAVFEEFAQGLKGAVGHVPPYLVQGTLYPDVIESSPAPQGKGKAGNFSTTIKSHHNVGGLPEKMRFKLIEPLRDLFKDEVRVLGGLLGVPKTFLRRHPFPGPGLAVRILGEITPECLETLRSVDEIFIDSLHKEGIYDEIWQAFAVFLPIRSVGVQGDGRTHDHVVGLRAVTSADGMTADWYPFDPKILARISTRICNEVKGVNRVVYDISSKPPATIEWE